MAFTYKPYQKSKKETEYEGDLKWLQEHKPTTFNSEYQGLTKDALDKYVNRKKFNYDLNGDALYNQYKDQYMTQGKLAMQDAIGQASAMTGGYGNSYAETVGNQAYQGYLGKLNEVVPQLYQLAYDKYNQEGNDMLNTYNIYNTQLQNDYSKYRDSLDDYYKNIGIVEDRINNERNYNYGVYSDDRNMAFDKYKQQVSEDQWNKEYKLSKDQTKLNSYIDTTKMQTYNAPFEKIIKKKIDEYGTQNGYPKAWEEIEEKINEAVDGGKINEAEYNYLMDKYVGSAKK